MNFRTATICAFLLASLALGGCAHTVRSIDWSESIYARADAYSRGAGLGPLRDGGEAEIRVWANHVMIGEIVGRITTPERSEEHTLKSRLAGDSAMVITHVSHRDLHSLTPTPLLEESLSQLYTLDGQTWGCTTDGVSILVDGIVDGRRFAFSAGDPDFCDDERSRLAVRSIRQLAPSNWRPIRW